MKINLRQLASAFLFRGDQVLLMKKPASKWQRQSEPFYAAVGGHMEPEEVNDPLVACFREIEEETGLRREEIHRMRLRYILIRQKEAEIRVQYVYTGEVTRTELVASAEGQPEWQAINGVPPLLSSAFMRAVWQHLMTEGLLQEDRVITGTMAIDHEGRPFVHWSPLVDPLVF